MFQLIAADLDGTLLTPDHRLGSYTASTLKQLNQKGCQLILASGRHASEVSDLRNTLGLPAFMITANGARTYTPTNEPLLHKDLPADVVEAIISALIDKPGITVHLYQDSGWYFNQYDEALLSYHKDTALPRFFCNRDALPTTFVTKLFFSCHDTHRLAAYGEELQSRFSDKVAIAFSLPWSMEVTAAGVSKGNAMQRIARHLNISPKQCIAFGDGLNDADMLTTAGKGLIMQNADKRLKQRLPALEIIGSDAEEAVATYLEKTFSLNDPGISAAMR
ncbi:Cof-type HAD-IIB family hydrolase [Kistimonas asteriae]|uniref:Cof-type HAD-IIB family hydrolase n=1 Tax=Kistimonas asteriae TaxID=517724 RepID=UPI001BAB142A|nr:Cof-type HAD-IIB family hydrolase [Kistimonas asteriae]